MSGAQLCATLKDKTKNGNRDLAALTEHMETEALVIGLGILASSRMARRE
jgi:hypothetical protein